MCIKTFPVVFIMVWGLYSCGPAEIDNKIKYNFICIKESDTAVSIKIINNGDRIIYVPNDYDACYTANTDTIHLEAFDNPKYHTEYYYLYKHLLPYELYVAKKITGFAPDSTLTYTRSISYNQFRASATIPVYPDSIYYRRLIFKLPTNVKVVTAAFYKKSYADDKHMRQVGYTFEDFMKFEKQNVEYITASLIDRYYFK